MATTRDDRVERAREVVCDALEVPRDAMEHRTIEQQPAYLHNSGKPAS